MAMKETKTNDYTFFDFSARGTRVLGDNEISVHNKKKAYSITLNSAIRKAVEEWDECRVRVRLDNLTGDIHFVFNQTQGACVNINRKGKCITINSVELVSWLARHFGIEAETSVKLRVSNNLSNSAQYATYLVTKK